MDQRIAWLLLTHHLPPDPPYFRVKIRRRLKQLGAVPLKNSVYALPDGDDALEDFQWLRQEIEREGGEAAVCQATFVDTATDARLVERLRVDREADYREVIAATRDLESEIATATDEPSLGVLRRKVGRLEQRLHDIVATDAFGAPGRAEARSALADVGRRLRRDRDETERTRPVAGSAGRRWVTREGIKVDRIASGWLIRRFIDAAARFAFVPARGYEPAEGELRFDMFEGEYTHVGEACTFEVLLTSFDLHDPALAIIGQIVHDIDCKDDKFGRPEVGGVAALIDGIVRSHEDDETRLDRGTALLDELYRHLSATAS